MLFLKLPFAVKPGLTDSRFCEDAKPYRLNIYVPKLVKVVALVRIDRLSRVWFAKLNRMLFFKLPLPLSQVSLIQDFAKMLSNIGLL